jgi:acyl-CoA thioester hydrolase
MARPNPARLSIDIYPHHDVIQARFQDLDVLGHINNVAFAALFETGRVRFNHVMGLMRRRGHRWLVANVEINYLAEGRMADVQMGTGIDRIGTRSWSILASAFQAGRCIATCDTVIVMEQVEGLAELPADFRADLEKWRLKF